MGQQREWTVKNRRLDAAGAVSLIFERLYQTFGRAEGVLLTLPTYLTDAQEGRALQLAAKARWPLFGSTPTPTAAALAAYERLPWSGMALVADVDGSRLHLVGRVGRGGSCSVGSDARLPAPRPRGWLNRLLNGAAGSLCAYEPARSARLRRR